MIHPGTPTIRRRHARIHRHFRRRVFHAPRHARGRSIRFLADEERNARHTLAALDVRLIGIQELQLAGAVFSVGREWKGKEGEGGVG